MNAVTRVDVDAAIATIEDSRRTHVEWAAWLEAGPPGTSCGTPGCDRDHHADVDVAGDLEHHRRCIAGYDQVLELLRHLRESTAEQLGR